MGVIPAATIGSTVAAITHMQRVDNALKETKNSTNRTNVEPTDYETVSSSKVILEELKKILEQEKCKDENSISLYDLTRVMRLKYKYWQIIENGLKHYINSKTGDDWFYLDIEYDGENSQLIISRHGNKAFFTKKDGDLIIVKSSWHSAKDVLGKCGDEISKCYDKFIEDISFYRDYMKNIKLTNSNFLVSTSKNEICISEKTKDISEFELSAKIYKEEYEHDCNSNNITSVCRNNEDEIFKRVFVKIEDCPECVHEQLYEIRKLQLEEEAKIEYKEMQKQKRLELVRKLNPFRKK